MFPGKEQYLIFEKYGKKHERNLGIKLVRQKPDKEFWYNDAVTLKVQFRKNLMDLMEIYNHKLSKGDNWSVTTMFIPFEEDDGFLRGVRLVVGFYVDKKRNLEFLTIELFHEEKPLNYKAYKG